jgi:hypothetical protein
MFDQGNVNENLDFTISEDSSVFFGCSASANGEFYVFGGSGKYSRQVR